MYVLLYLIYRNHNDNQIVSPLYTEDPCKQPPDDGPCTGGIPRWFYNRKTDACERFYYGGCKGNENRFKTQEACRGRCSPCPSQLCTTLCNYGFVYVDGCITCGCLDPCKVNLRGERMKPFISITCVETTRPFSYTSVHKYCSGTVLKHISKRTFSSFKYDIIMQVYLRNPLM